MSSLVQLGLVWLLAALAQGAGWLWQRRTRNAGIVDAIWAAGVGGAAVVLAALGGGAAWSRVTLAVLGAVWGLRLAVHFADQRAGCIDIVEPARLRGSRNDLGHAMRAEYHGATVRHLVQFLDEDRTHAAQPVDDIAVMDDFVTDVDRRPEALDRQFDDLDGAVDTGAEAARRGDQDVERGMVRGHIGADVSDCLHPY